MHADVLGVFDRLAPGDPDPIFLRLNGQAVTVRTRQLDDRDQILALLEHVYRRVAPSCRCDVSEPITGKPSLESALKRKERLEGIVSDCHDHTSGRQDQATVLDL